MHFFSTGIEIDFVFYLPLVRGLSLTLSEQKNVKSNFKDPDPY